MLDESMVEEWRRIICDRFTPEELVELLSVTTEEVFDRFREECLDIDKEALYD